MLHPHFEAARETKIYQGLAINPRLIGKLKPETLPSLLSPVPSRYMPAPAVYYNVEVVQFWRGHKEPLQPYPLHWVIYIPTSPGIGNTYHIQGNTDSYTVDFRRNQPYLNPDEWRGSFTVGKVAAHQLTLLERHLASVPITRHDLRWNCQSWVWEGLRHLRHKGFNISWEVRLSYLQTQMYCLLEDWEYGRI